MKFLQYPPEFQDMSVFEDGTSKEAMMLKWDIRAGSIWWLVSYQKRNLGHMGTLRMHKEDPVGTQGEGGHPKPERQAPEETKPADTSILDSNLQNYKK